MSKCAWCGNVITGDPVLSFQCPVIVGDTGVELVPEYVGYFCCNGCAWAFTAETHRLMGLSGKDLRAHLIDMHGLSHPPGKPAGDMRSDCFVVGMAQSLASIFSRT